MVPYVVGFIVWGLLDGRFAWRGFIGLGFIIIGIVIIY